jgi:benzoate/toluate 1,2-dioxygenase beta subunit/2,4,5-trichlorophenoxyacetic acid oxygenase 2
MSAPSVKLGDPEAQRIAQNVIQREAHALDEQCWNEWLDLYTESAVFWLPAWVDEHRTTQDVDREMSHIYHRSRLELSERVRRVTSNKSASALPLPRTAHLVGPPLIVRNEAGSLIAKSSAVVNIFHPVSMRHHVTASRYEHRLKLDGRLDAWFIESKKITMINSCMPSVIDFYSI